MTVKSGCYFVNHGEYAPNDRHARTQERNNDVLEYKRLKQIVILWSPPLSSSNKLYGPQCNHRINSCREDSKRDETRVELWEQLTNSKYPSKMTSDIENRAVREGAPYSLRKSIKWLSVSKNNGAIRAHLSHSENLSTDLRCRKWSCRAHVTHSENIPDSFEGAWN